MGKSTVLRLFKRLGAYTVDADELVHEIMKKKRIIKKVADLLGEDVVVKGRKGVLINKRRVAEIVFNNPEKRRALEGIIHPGVFKKMEAVRRAIYRKRPEAVIVFEVPLLFETGCEGMFDKIVVVHCTRERAIERLMKKGFSRNEIMKRMAIQMPIREKKKRADFLIDNNGSPATTLAQVREIMRAVTRGMTTS